MTDTTMTTLSKMILSFDDQRIEQFYQNFIKVNPDFKVNCVDRVVAVFIKLERLFKHHFEMEEFYFRLQEQRQSAEKEYNDWARNSKFGKSLEELLESDPEIKNVFTRLIDIGSSNKYLGKEGVDFLIEAERVLDNKLAQLHKQQISLDQHYITNSWHSNRRLAKVIKDLAYRLPVSHEKTDIHVCERGSQKIVFKLCEEFRASFKPTPSGFHYIRLDDFITVGVEQICLFFPTDQFHYVRSVVSEVLEDLYRELEEYYSTFHGTQTKIDQAFEEREQNAEKLHEKLSELKELVSAYARQLDRLSQQAEKVESYADKIKVLRTPKPPPSLRRG